MDTNRDAKVYIANAHGFFLCPVTRSGNDYIPLKQKRHGKAFGVFALVGGRNIWLYKDCETKARAFFNSCLQTRGLD